MDSVDKSIRPIIEAYIPKNESVILSLKGANKEYLICTDKRVHIIKKGFMTGHTFGAGKFNMPYGQITSVELDTNLITGYLEISSGGVQNTRRSMWSTEPDKSAQMTPNVVSVKRSQFKDFQKAVDTINELIHSNS